MNKKIRFAHLADLHLGSYREKNLTKLNFIAFQRAVTRILKENIDFCIFAGDIFNNAMPPIEIVNEFAKEINKLNEASIRIYIIGGSHDYSPSGKSYLELLQTTKVLQNVAKWQTIDANNRVKLLFTEDKQTNTSFSGILGKKNGLDKNIYSKIDKFKLNKENFNIFVFHTTLNDLKPKNMQFKSEITTSHLPRGFDYYAGGHIHSNVISKYDKGVISYSGALFPNNFSELRYEEPTFNICEFDFGTRNTKVEKVVLDIYKKIYVPIEIKNKNPIEAKNQIIEEIDKFDIENKIVLLEIYGDIDGRIPDIQINKIIAKLYEKGVYHVLKNTYKLKSNLLEKITINKNENIEEMENEIIEEQLSVNDNNNSDDANDNNDKDKEELDKKQFENEFRIIKNLLKLEVAKIEGEKVQQYEERVSNLIEEGLYKK